jgi:hypothetical protein
MQLPLTDPDTLFEELLQDLPSETVQMARACKALVRVKKVKTSVQLLRVVFCGLVKPWREVAGTFTALYESMTDQSVAERLRACGPWVKAMLRQMLPMTAVEPLPTGRRFVVIDASSMQAPRRRPPASWVTRVLAGERSGTLAGSMVSGSPSRGSATRASKAPVIGPSPAPENGWNG